MLIAMSNRHYAIFIEPSGELRNFIMQGKREIEQLFPDSPYLNHPPHSTLIYGQYCDPEDWIPQLERMVSPLSSFSINIKQSMIFYDDQPTGGGHTMVLKAEPEPELMQLQLQVGEVLSHHLPETPKIVYPFIKNEPFYSSHMKYGFPFVGSHWIPHFTIASLKQPRDIPTLTKFGQQSFALQDEISAIKVIHINDGHHHEIHSITLEGMNG